MLYSLLALAPSAALAFAGPRPTLQATAPAESCGEARSVEGTIWEGEESDMLGRFSGDKLVLEFIKDGKFAYTTTNGRFAEDNTWQQDGGCVVMSINDNRVEMRGQIADDEKMEGTAKQQGQYGMSWSWRVRRRAAPGSEFDALRQQYKRAYGMGRFAEAAQIAERAARAAEREWGPTDPNLLTTLNELALIYQMDSKFAPAAPVIQRALALCEQKPGRQSKEYVSLLNTLGKNYCGLEKYAEAEDVYRQALAASETLLGANDPQVAALLNNLGNLYTDQDRYTEAEPYLERSLQMIEKRDKPDKTEFASALNNLAVAKKELGKYDEALMLYERSLALLEQLGGENHPVVARVLDNLASLYERKGWKEEAADARARAQRIRSGR
jgi:tetratricopeptide (TPR) repeat protein